MTTQQKFVSSFSVVLGSSLVSGLLLLQQDLQACSIPPQGAFVATCSFHWQLIAAAFVTALVSAAIHALQSHLAAQQSQISDLQSATPSYSSPIGIQPMLSVPVSGQASEVVRQDTTAVVTQSTDIPRLEVKGQP